MPIGESGDHVLREKSALPWQESRKKSDLKRKLGTQAEITGVLNVVFHETPPVVFREIKRKVWIPML